MPSTLNGFVAHASPRHVGTGNMKRQQQEGTSPDRRILCLVLTLMVRSNDHNQTPELRYLLLYSNQSGHVQQSPTMIDEAISYTHGMKQDIKNYTEQRLN